MSNAVLQYAIAQTVTWIEALGLNRVLLSLLSHSSVLPLYRLNNLELTQEHVQNNVSISFDHCFTTGLFLAQDYDWCCDDLVSYCILLWSAVLVRLPLGENFLQCIGSGRDLDSYRFLVVNIVYPSVGSCHHGMARPLGCGWGSRPPDMEVSCEYIE